MLWFLWLVYYSQNGEKITRRRIEKQLESEKFKIIIPSRTWVNVDGGTNFVDQRIRTLLRLFFLSCNSTFLHYRNTIDYLRTDIGYYLAKYHYIYIYDDLIWYALFSTRYSLYNYSQNLTNLKYKRQYDYGYLTENNE